MLAVENIHKHYEGQPLLRGVSFTVAPGETICLLGPSGSGKSTLLRIISGLESAEAGRVTWDGADLSGMPVHKRQFGLMFQDYALFPHRSVTENVAFGLRMQNLARPEIDRRVAEALERVNLAGFGGRRVTDLSGGEQQRVALARALAPRPRLLMLDEPLGALDRSLREALGQFLREVLHQTGIPAVYVTHDQEEAFAIADRLVLLREGRVEQDDTPENIYRRPASAWTARFLGLSNLVPGTLAALDPLQVETALGRFTSACSGEPPLAAGSPVTLLLRPAGLQPAEAGSPNTLAGRVEDVVFRGEGYRITLECAGGLRLDFHLAHPPQAGAHVVYRIDPESVLCLG